MSAEAITPRERSERLKGLIKWVLAVAGLGLLDSIWLLILHAANGSLSGVCSLAPRVSCDALFVREYSEWFGIPVPIFSILYFVLLIALSIRVLRSDDRQLVRPYAYLWILGWLGLGTTLYMAYIALIVLKTFCPFCAVLWAVLITLWVLTRKLMRVLDQTWGYLLSEDLKSGYKSAWFWAMAVVAGVVLAGSYFFFHRAVGHLTGTAVEIVGEDARSLGPANARTTIVIYSDFQCPWCKIASEVLQQLSTEMSGDIRVTYKFYPLDHNCNPSVRRPMHLYACSAAVAAYCASTQDKFWIYHDYVFTSQDELPDVRLLEFARASQLDLMKFDACVRDNRSREEVQKNIAEGIRLGVQVTPSIFINGQLYSGPITLSAIRDTIAASK